MFVESAQNEEIHILSGIVAFGLKTAIWNRAMPNDCIYGGFCLSGKAVDQTVKAAILGVPVAEVPVARDSVERASADVSLSEK